MVVRQLLLEKFEPEYKYASISLSIVLAGCLYFLTYMLVRMLIEKTVDRQTPLQTLSQNSQNFTATFGVMIIFLTWSFNVLSQIMSIGKEQQAHARLLRKSAFVCKIIYKDEEKGTDMAEISEICADHIENLDVYPKAILSLEVRPSMVYVFFGYIVSTIGAFTMAEVSGGSNETDEPEANLNFEIQMALLVSLGLPTLYIFIHVLGNRDWELSCVKTLCK